MVSATHDHVLRVLREQAGMTLAQLALRCDVSASHLSMIEGGRRTPSVAVLMKVAHALNLVELEALLAPWCEGRL